jgi:RNA polymerase sigma-70 factor (ECF subfamily)
VHDEDTLLRFEQAVLPHLGAAYNLARWLMRDVHDAEDIVQQAALRACGAFGEFRGSDARSWLLAIVRNACFSELRRQRRTQPAPPDVIDGTVPAPAAQSDPQRALLNRLDREALAAAIEQLPDAFREVFVLREMEGLDYAQIAAVAQIPMGTVMSRLSRARQRLQDSLAGRIESVEENSRGMP